MLVRLVDSGSIGSNGNSGNWSSWWNQGGVGSTGQIKVRVGSTQGQTGNVDVTGGVGKTETGGVEPRTGGPVEKWNQRKCWKQLVNKVKLGQVVVMFPT